MVRVYVSRLIFALVEAAIADLQKKNTLDKHQFRRVDSLLVEKTDDSFEPKENQLLKNA